MEISNAPINKFDLDELLEAVEWIEGKDDPL